MLLKIELDDVLKATQMAVVHALRFVSIVEFYFLARRRGDDWFEECNNPEILQCHERF